MDVYSSTVIEIADDLGLEVGYLHKIFEQYLTDNSELTPVEGVTCYAVYRLVKMKQAKADIGKSRELWKARALAHGWNGDD